MSNLINFSVVIIGKDEALTIPRLIATMGNYIKDGGDVQFLDTGSKDGTPDLCRSLGLNVKEVGTKYITIATKQMASKMNKKYIIEGEQEAVKAGEKVFDFAGARNEVHAMAKHDMVLAVDCSDIFEAFDYKCICDIISEGKKIKFNYDLENGEGPGAVRVEISRFYDRRVFQWKCRVHECIYGNFNANQAMRLPNDILMTRHKKVHDKVRSMYTLGMMLDIQSKTHLCRSMYYLARELYYHNRNHSAIKLMKEYVQMKESWIQERSSGYCIIAECYERLGEIDLAIQNYQKAFETFPNRRASLIQLGYLYDKLALEEKDSEKKSFLYRKALISAIGALEIPYGLSGFEENMQNFSYRPHEIAYRAYINLGDKEKAKPHFEKALAGSGGAVWILAHKHLFE